MNHSVKIIVIPILLLGLTLCLTSCKPTPTLAVLTTTNVTDITEITATTGGNVTSDGNAEVTSKGVCWNTSENPTIANSKTSDGAGTGSFNSCLTELMPDTKYYVRAYATNSEGTGYGNQVSFTSSPMKDFYVLDVQDETNWDYWAVGKGGGSFMIQLQNSIPSIVYFKPLLDQDGYTIFLDSHGLPSKTIIGDYVFLFGNFRKSLMDVSVVLPDGEIKMFRDIQIDYDFTSGFSKSQEGAISEILKWSGRITGTVGCAVGLLTAPTGLGLALAYVGCGALIVNLIADLNPEKLEILGLSATTVGTVATLLGCVNVAVSPTCILGLASKGESITAKALEAAEKKKEQINVATGQLKTNLIVTTSQVTEFLDNSATLGGKVTPEGVALVMERGVFYGTSQNPESTGTKLQIGSGIGLFATTVPGLTPKTLYYIRAYAINNAGTAYGAQQSFTTLNSSELNETFEPYVPSSFPNSWVADGNGTDISNNHIDNFVSYSGTKSLKLFGSIGGCWAAIAYHTLVATPPFEVEIAIRNGYEILSGCHPYRALIGLREGTTWSNPARTFIQFDGNGKVYGGGGKELSTYKNNTWYLVRIKYEKISTTEIKLSYWINNNYMGYEAISAISDENLLNNFEISVGEGSAWFDDIKILK